MNRTVLLSMAALTAFGCKSDNTLVQGGEGLDPLDNQPVPCIVVEPEVVDFNPIRVTVDPAETRVVTIKNVCAGDLEIVRYELEAQDMPYDLGAVASPLVTNGNQVEFTVTFDPQTTNFDPEDPENQGRFSTNILIDSNDPENPVVAVKLNGEAVAPIIEVTPDSYDYGAPFIGCLNEQPYRVSNVGNATLTLEDFEFTTAAVDEFDFDERVVDSSNRTQTLPVDVEPADAVDVYVEYMALDTFEDSSFLKFVSNDPFTPEVLVTSQGTGTKYGEFLDLFEQPLKSATDIMFTLDRSCSMQDDNESVVANFNTFISTLAGLDADYHVAVIVEDDGCVLGSDPYIDNSFSASDAESTFETMADVYFTLGSYGANTERGFSLAEAGLASRNIGSGGCNEGMYRDEAFLSIVHVSDEPEQSVNPYTYYVALFQSYKADPDDVVINAVAGDYPSGCGTAMAGTGYYEGTVATGGLFLSICAEDWAEHLENLAEGSVAINNSFQLTQIPVPQTIEVRVDSIETNTGWEYDASTNSVVFETDFIPAPGSDVAVAYELMPDCEG